MAISYIADASWQSTTSNSAFTLNKPTGTQSGDYMVAMVAIDTFNSSGGDVTVTPPSGWTSQGHVYSASNLVLDVMTRTVGGSDPSSWGGSFANSEDPKLSIVTTYRGVAGLAIDGTSSTGSATSLATATVNNPASDNWRVVCGAYVSATVSNALTSNETSNRDNEALETLEGGMWDSNATLATGNTSRTVSRAAVWESAATWIGILDAGTNVVNAPGGTGTAATVSNAAKNGIGAKAQVIG